MKTDLIYGVEDRPPFKDALFAALQHLLAIFVAIITPPLIIASALKLDVEKTSFLVSMSLFASGVSTFIQCRRIGPIGAKLLCIQGPRYQLLLYRSYHSDRISRRTSADIRLLYSCRTY